jgi:hypothetical protein
MHIELIFPGPHPWQLEGVEHPVLVLTEARRLVSAVPQGVEIVEAPNLVSRGEALVEVARELRRCTKPLLVVTANAVNLGAQLIQEGVSTDRFRVHCVSAGSKPFSARISPEGHLLAFAVDGGTRSVYNTFSYAS